MQQKFTPEDLVRFLYRETPASETLAIHDALHDDEALAATFDELVEGFQQLPRVQFSPSSKAINRILMYSDQETLV